MQLSDAFGDRDSFCISALTPLPYRFSYACRLLVTRWLQQLQQYTHVQEEGTRDKAPFLVILR